MASVVWAAPNSADYHVKIHVVSSQLQNFANIKASITQIRSAIIDGKKCELSGYPVTISNLTLGLNRYGLISLGDYPAKVTINNHRGAYLYDTQYGFLFPDGKTMKFTVTGKLNNAGTTAQTPSIHCSK